MANKITTLFEDETKTNILFPRTKRLAISDENNNPLTEVGFYTADTVLSSVESIMPGGVTAELLWENSDTTVDFSPQTLNIDTSDYEMLYIFYKTAKSYTNYSCAICLRGDMGLGYIHTTVAGNILRSRTVVWKTNGSVQFNTCYRWQTYNSSTTEDNSCLVPYRIYGIKSVIAAKGQMVRDLLWINPSLDSSFAAQTVEVDLSKYNLVGISFKRSTGSETYTPTYLLNIGSIWYWDDLIGGYMVERRVETTSSSIIFGDSSRLNTYPNGTRTTDNSAQIPYQIWGIR